MLRVIAVIKEKKSIVGYRLYDEKSMSIGDFRVQEAYKQLAYYGCSHARLEGQTLVCDDGSINSLPVLDSRTLECVENDVLIVIGVIRKENKTVGYRVTDFSGETVNLSVQDFLSYANSTGVYNAKVQNRDGKPVISAIKGSFPVIQHGENTSHSSNNLLFTDYLTENTEKFVSSYVNYLTFFIRKQGYGVKLLKRDYKYTDNGCGNLDGFGIREYSFTLELSNFELKVPVDFYVSINNEYSGVLHSDNESSYRKFHSKASSIQLSIGLQGNDKVFLGDYGMLSYDGKSLTLDKLVAKMYDFDIIPKTLAFAVALFIRESDLCTLGLAGQYYDINVAERTELIEETIRKLQNSYFKYISTEYQSFVKDFLSSRISDGSILTESELTRYNSSIYTSHKNAHGLLDALLYSFSAWLKDTFDDCGAYRILGNYVSKRVKN